MQEGWTQTQTHFGELRIKLRMEKAKAGKTTQTILGALHTRGRTQETHTTMREDATQEGGDADVNTQKDNEGVRTHGDTADVNMTPQRKQNKTR